MSTLTSYNGLQVVTPSPTGGGGLAINNNFKALSTYVGTVNPAAGNDSTQGYAVGSRWYNSSTTVEWVCLDNTASAAVWTAVDSGALAGYLPLAGGTLTGPLTVDTSSSGLANLAYFCNTFSEQGLRIRALGTWERLPGLPRRHQTDLRVSLSADPQREVRRERRHRPQHAGRRRRQHVPRRSGFRRFGHPAAGLRSLQSS